jgi:hypothetical protein
VSGPVTEMDERGQEPVDEHQPVLRAGTHCPLPLARGKPGLVTLMPQRADFSHEFWPSRSPPGAVCVNTISSGPARTDMWESPDGYGVELAKSTGLEQKQHLARLPTALGVVTGRLVSQTRLAPFSPTSPRPLLATQSSDDGIRQPPARPGQPTSPPACGELIQGEPGGHDVITRGVGTGVAGSEHGGHQLPGPHLAVVDERHQRTVTEGPLLFQAAVASCFSECARTRTPSTSTITWPSVAGPSLPANSQT